MTITVNGLFCGTRGLEPRFLRLSIPNPIHILFGILHLITVGIVCTCNPTRAKVPTPIVFMVFMMFISNSFLYLLIILKIKQPAGIQQSQTLPTMDTATLNAMWILQFRQITIFRRQSSCRGILSHQR